MFMKKIIHNTIYSLACLAGVFFLAGCDTDIESVDINEPGIKNQNAALYADYLANLRAYKQSHHKVVFGWLDNSEKLPASQGQTITAVPDSLDYLVLTSPHDLTRQELEMMISLREEKGTKTLYEVSFAKIKASYDEAKEAFLGDKANEGKIFTSFKDFLVNSVQEQLISNDQYGFDGLVMAFESKYKQYLIDAEKQEVEALENIFLGIAKDWKQRHTNKMLVLAGKPQNVEDQSVLALASYLIVPCQASTNASDVAYIVNKAAGEGVPTDKFVPWVTTTSLDETDLRTGYWAAAVPAVLGAAKWVATSHEAYQVAGLAIDNLGNNYYNVSFTYPHVRTAISIINPTVKK